MDTPSMGLQAYLSSTEHLSTSKAPAKRPTTAKTSDVPAKRPTTATTSKALAKPSTTWDGNGRLEQCQLLINYTFKDGGLLREALLASGLPVKVDNASMGFSLTGHKRLAILGDKAMVLALSDLWYDGELAGVGSDLGDHSGIVQRVTARKVLADKCSELGIDRLVIRTQQNEPISAKTMTNTMQAILGAVFKDAGKDRGLDAVASVMKFIGLIAEKEHTNRLDTDAELYQAH